jgi:phosphoribosylformimino-5-aminoimidazole carboxamide ribonucleotide (ProFAR) isomerase
LQLIPAVDLMQGKVVRLSRGDPKTAKVYTQFGSAVETATKWKRDGAKKLHVIDLDAAFGTGDNLSVIAEIVKSVDLPVQVGGGIRTGNYPLRQRHCALVSFHRFHCFFESEFVFIKGLANHSSRHADTFKRY